MTSYKERKTLMTVSLLTVSHLSIYDLSISLVTEAQLCHNLKFQGFNELWLLSVALFAKNRNRINARTVSLYEYTRFNAASFLFIDLGDTQHIPYLTYQILGSRVTSQPNEPGCTSDSTKYHSTSPSHRWDDETFDEPHFVRGTRRYNTTTFAIGPRSPRWDSHSFEPRHDTSRWRPEEQEAE